MFKFSGQPERCSLLQRLLIWILCFLLSSGAFAKNVRQEHFFKPFLATVVSVADGDTVRVIDEHGQKHKVRLSYIDAPELNQAGGQDSKKALYQLVYREEVRVEVFDIDRYKRKVARLVMNGQDINLEQIRSGNAWHYESIAKQQQHPDDYRLYHQTQQESQNKRLGLWKNHHPIAPWTFRHQQRTHH